MKSSTSCLGLSKDSSRSRRRSADDSGIIESHGSDRFNDDLALLHNPEELKELIRNQRRLIQQLQMRIRLNIPDIIQSPTIEKQVEKLNEQNRVRTTPLEENSNVVFSSNALESDVGH